LLLIATPVVRVVVVTVGLILDHDWLFASVSRPRRAAGERLGVRPVLSSGAVSEARAGLE
jgi:hypothetical protein